MTAAPGPHFSVFSTAIISMDAASHPRGPTASTAAQTSSFWDSVRNVFIRVNFQDLYIFAFKNISRCVLVRKGLTGYLKSTFGFSKIRSAHIPQPVFCHRKAWTKLWDISFNFVSPECFLHLSYEIPESWFDLPVMYRKLFQKISLYWHHYDYTQNFIF